MHGLTTTTRVARKQWHCLYGGHAILEGERYVEESLAPWALIGDDVDDDTGATIYREAGEWSHARWHDACWRS